jgi:EmrB/QacA subfamily drug resistance transporter
MTEANSKKKLGWILAVYLLGVFIGAIDTGILTPARTVVQNSLGVDEKTGIWMITAFTLAYACSMPILGKVADYIGRKWVYIVAIALFGTGSLICGLSNFTNNFTILIIGRVIQAIGGGGIVPLATAEFGTSFPEEKRGMALGLVGGIYGIANILGATLGSAILDFVGLDNWHWLFFINLPICVFVVLAGLFVLPKGEKKETQRADILGTVVLVIMVLSLLYGLNNLDFFDFKATIISKEVYPFLIAFVALVPLFTLIEKRAADPILNIRYFRDSRIVVTLILAVIVGICLMGMVFVPQFAENALKTREGSGGYFVTILGLFAGLGSPFSGRLVDKYGPKKVLYLGFLISLAGALYLALYATVHASVASVIISLVLVGSGLGFVMGTPLNYMMLANTPKEQSNSALSTLSLMRSIGTTIGPILMIGFIAQAGSAAQDNIMNILPPVSSIQVNVDPALTDGIKADLSSIKTGLSAANEKQAKLASIVDDLDARNSTLQAKDASVQAQLADMKSNKAIADMMDDMDFTMPAGQDTPDFAEIREMLSKNSGMSVEDIDKYSDMLDVNNQGDMDFDMNGDGELPDDVMQRLQSSSVTTITDDVVYLVQRMFALNTPAVVKDIQDGITEGIDGIGEGVTGLADARDGISDGIDGLNSGIDGIGEGIDGAQQGIDGMKDGITGMDKAVVGIGRGIEGISKGITKMKRGVDGISQGIAGMEQGLAGLDGQIAATQNKLNAAMGAGDPTVIGPLQGQLQGLKAARSSLATKLDSAAKGKKKLEAALKVVKQKARGMQDTITTIKAAQKQTSALIIDVTAEREMMISMQSEMKDAVKLMVEMRDIMTDMSADMMDAQTRLTTLRDGMPGYFDAALVSYTDQVKAKKPEIEAAFQSTLNAGFTRMYYAVAVLCVLACIGLAFYRQPPAAVKETESLPK